MAMPQRTIVRVIRKPDLMGARGPNMRSGFSTPVRGAMSDGSYLDLSFHRAGGADIPDRELIGLTLADARLLVTMRALPHSSVIP